MPFWPVPDVMKDDIYEINPEMLLNRGISFVMLDVDNTIAPYTLNEVDQKLKGWVQEMKAAGLTLFILSNNRGERPRIFAETLEIEYVGKAWKPFTKAARKVLVDKGVSAEKAAIIGDQIYTDTACAKWLGATAVVVHPIEFTNFFLKFRYWLETPFRFLYKCKTTK